MDILPQSGIKVLKIEVKLNFESLLLLAVDALGSLLFFTEHRNIVEV